MKATNSEAYCLLPFALMRRTEESSPQGNMFITRIETLNLQNAVKFVTVRYFIIIIIEFLTSQLWLGNIHLSWDVVINRIRLGGLICSLKSFLQLNVIIIIIIIIIIMGRVAQSI